jgi:predicted metal-dependent HD superfamily phosphohydrolase
MDKTVVIVRCPRCGSMDAESVEAIHIEFDRMKCAACGHEQVCDYNQIKDEWNESVPDGEIPREQWHLLPSERFYALWAALGAQGYGRDTLLRLRAAYDEKHRAYHTARHIGACLRLLDDAEILAAAAHPAEVEAALWFHDAVYDTHARDNEERSAQMAEETLSAAGVASDVVARIAAHVRATKAHEPDSADGQLVIDIDLSILGEAPEVFSRFEDEIRREYGWVEEAAYLAGRAAVLRGFAARPFIYGTPLFRARYEANARANLAASLVRLELRRP